MSDFMKRTLLAMREDCCERIRREQRILELIDLRLIEINQEQQEEEKANGK